MEPSDSLRVEVCMTAYDRSRALLKRLKEVESLPAPHN